MKRATCFVVEHGNLYIADPENFRVLRVQAGRSESELCWGGFSALRISPSSLGFHKGCLYLVSADPSFVWRDCSPSVVRDFSLTEVITATTHAHYQRTGSRHVF